MKKIPFAGSFTLNAAHTIPAKLGYKIRLRGILISLGPWETVSGSSNLQITGLTCPVDLGGFGDGNYQVTIQPSVTDSINLPLVFGEAGIEASDANVGIVFQLTATGDDVPVGHINVWGEYVSL